MNWKNAYQIPLMFEVGIFGRLIVRERLHQVLNSPVATFDALIADLLVSALDELLAIEYSVAHRHIASRAQMWRAFLNEMIVLLRSKYLNKVTHYIKYTFN